VFTLAGLATLLTAAPAFAQVQLQGLAGMTDAGERAPFFGAALGFRVSFIEVDIEGGRMRNVLPIGVLSALTQLEQQANLPVNAVARMPATYGLGQLRFISPGGLVRPFVGAGLGVAHIEPQIDVQVDGIDAGDVFGLTEFKPQNKTLGLVSAGLRFDFHVVNIEAGYRYMVIFSHFEPSTNTNKDTILTRINTVYGAVAIRF
jgi:hypothetical protein